MTEKQDIYKAPETGQNRKEDLPVVDLTKAEARARTWRNSIGFTLLMLVMLALAAWLMFRQEKKLEEQDVPEGDITGHLILPMEREGRGRGPLLVAPEIESLSEMDQMSADGTPFVIDPQKMAAAMEQMRMADRYLKSRSWDPAELHARKALNIWPNMNAAYRMLGVIYTQRGQFDQAIIAFEKALETKPFSAETFNNLATAYMHRGNMGRAEELLLNAIEIQPEYIVSHLNLGLLYLAVGQYESAIEFMTRALQEMPRDPNLRNNLAVGLLRVGRYDESREHLQVLIDVAPDIAPPYINMAITYALEKKYPEALKWIQQGSQYCSPVVFQQYLSDSDFDGLRGHPEFQSMLRDMYPDLPVGPEG